MKLALIPKVLFGFFLFFALLICKEQEPKKNPPKAVRGVIDLRQWVADPLPNINLDGEWEFYWGEFLTPSDFLIKNSNSPIENSQFIPVPGNWSKFVDRPDLAGERSRTTPTEDGKPVGDYGFATYRLTVLLPKIDQPSVLSLKIENIGTSCQLFVNGQLVTSMGKVGKSKEESKPMYRYGLFSISPYLADSFKEQDSPVRQMEIIVQVSNFHNVEGGLPRPIVLGSSQKLEATAKQSFVLDIIVFSSLFIMGLYHLGLYLNRKKDLSALYFGILTILIAIRTVSTSERIILDAFPFLSFLFVHKLEYITFYYGSFVFLQFVYSLFPEEVSRRFYKVFGFILIPAIFAVILLPQNLYTQTLRIVQISALVEIVFITLILLFAIRNKRMGSKLFLFGFLILAATIAHDIIRNMGILFTPLIASYGLLSFVFFQSLILSKRIARGFEQVEELSQNLENKISEGVTEQQKYNHFLLELSSSKTINLLGLEIALQEITEACTLFLNVNRCSIWLLNARKDELKCFDLFMIKEHSHVKGLAFTLSECPKYFLSLNDDAVLSAPNVYLHARLTELNKSYHRIYDIQSAIQAPIQSGGRAIGIISFEQIGNSRNWTIEEENFVSAGGNIVANYLELNERQTTFSELTETKQELEELNNFTHIANAQTDLKEILITVSKHIYVCYSITSTWLFFTG